MDSFHRVTTVLLLFFGSIALVACGGAGTGSGDGRWSSGGSGSVQLAWQEPATKVDGTCAGDLGSYRFRYGLSPGNYDHTVSVPISQISCEAIAQSNACGPIDRCEYELNLSGDGAASWYLVMQAVDDTGNASPFSNEVTFTVQ